MRTARIAIAVAALPLVSASFLPVHADAPCDGVYESWGRACYGAAHVRNKSIEWNAQFSSCKRSPYEVLHSELGGEKPRVAYRFKKRSKGCGYEVMEIVAQRDGYWAIRGYQSVQDYRQRRDDPAVYDSCPVAPMPSERCNLPFARKP